MAKKPSKTSRKKSRAKRKEIIIDDWVNQTYQAAEIINKWRDAGVGTLIQVSYELVFKDVMELLSCKCAKGKVKNVKQ